MGIRFLDKENGLRSSRHGLYKLGYACVTMVVSMSGEREIWSKSQKGNRSSNCRLKFAYMKLESLVIVNQHVTVNIFGALYTPPVTSGEWDRPEVKCYFFLKEKKMFDVLRKTLFLSKKESFMKDGLITVMKS